MINAVRGLFAFSVLMLATPNKGEAAVIEYPQVIKVRYEAQDPKAGGNFVIWSEREEIQYGLDPRLFPAARYVEATQVTPSLGSITLTFIEVRTINGSTPDYLHDRERPFPGERHGSPLEQLPRGRSDEAVAFDYQRVRAPAR